MCFKKQDTFLKIKNAPPSFFSSSGKIKNIKVEKEKVLS